MDKTSTERSPKRFEGYIAELREALSARGLSSGRPGDLVSVAQALHPPGAVREEMASAIRSILSRQAVGLSRAEVAAMLVVAVGGTNLYVSGQEVDAVGQLDSFVDWVMAPLANVALGSDPVAQAVEPFWGIVGAARTGTGGSGGLGRSEAGLRADDAAGQDGVRERGDNGLRRTEVEVEPEGHPVASSFALPKRSLAPWITGACAGVVLLAGGLTWRHHGTERNGDVPNLQGAAVTSPVTGGLASVADGLPGKTAGTTGLPLRISMGAESARTPGPGSGQAAGDASASTPAEHGVAASTPHVDAIAGTPAAAAGGIAPAASQPIPSAAPATTRTGNAGGKPAGVPNASQVANGRFVVSSGMMSGHLIAAPEPAYPKMAKMWGVQGQVVLQAVVSRKGQVVAAYALDGHRLLRAAATNAVKKWRYKPYMKNGKPTDVDTVVIVDFKLPS